MSDVRLLDGDDFTAFVAIVANAYPAFDLPSAESREQFADRMHKEQHKQRLMQVYGLFRDGVLLGGMRLLDFTMNMAGTPIPMGGVGLVAVDLMHKKEHVAKELITFFLRHYRDKGASITSLYPFRPDFYKQMGFGYGTKMNQYEVKPSQLPKNGARQHVRLLNADDTPAMIACYTRVFEHTHGMFAIAERELTPAFEGFENRAVGYVRDNTLMGYAVFIFQKGANPLTNNIVVRNFVYQDREALAGLLAFFQSQADQIGTITINTQDAALHHLLLDPRNNGDMFVPPVAHESNKAGIGMMYRLINTAGFFENLREHSFGSQNCTLRFSARDDFLPENDNSVVVQFRDGQATLQPTGTAEAEIQLRIAEFSSLVTGVISFSKLHLYGLAEISNEAYIPIVDKLFATATPPVCTTRF